MKKDKDESGRMKDEVKKSFDSSLIPHPSSFVSKKRFGQHFLRDQNIIRKIVDGAGVSKDDIVLEIGPGLGDMTSLLSQKAEHVIAVELDRDLCSILSEKFAEKNVEIISVDALKFDIGGLYERVGRKIKVVANLPYNISTPVLFRLLEGKEYISSMTLMFQKEVADRLVAKPCTKDYGILSVYAQLYTAPSLLFKVSPYAFTPPPKVDSTVLLFKRKKSETINPKVVSALKTLFSFRRKIIASSLKIILKNDEEQFKRLTEILSQTILQKRIELLTVEETFRIANMLVKINNEK